MSLGSGSPDQTPVLTPFPKIKYAETRFCIAYLCLEAGERMRVLENVFTEVD